LSLPNLIGQSSVHTPSTKPAYKSTSSSRYIPRHFVPGIIRSKIFRALRFEKSRLITPCHFVPGIIRSKIFRALRFEKSRLIRISWFVIYYVMQNTAEFGRIQQNCAVEVGNSINFKYPGQRWTLQTLSD
jgi:hypothetical protein